MFHVAETYDGTDAPGQRVFDMLLEGQTVLDQFDISAAVGAYKATTRSFTVDVQDGVLDMTFKNQVENPKINAIQVLSIGDPSPVASAPPVQSPTAGGSSQVLYRVNAGGGQITDSEGQIWEADGAYLQNGLPFGPVSTPIDRTVDDFLYQTECYDPPTGDPMKFVFNVANGWKEIRLHFAELYGLVTGERVFTVKVNDQTVLTSHDIYAAVGANTADIEVVTAEVTDGLLVVEFEHEGKSLPFFFSFPSKRLSLILKVFNRRSFFLRRTIVENPKINAIEVYATDLAPPAPTPTPAPIPTQDPPVSTSFEPIYINVGSDTPITDTSTGITWEADKFFNTGISNSNTKSISGTSFQELYKTGTSRETSFHYTCVRLHAN